MNHSVTHTTATKTQFSIRNLLVATAFAAIVIASPSYISTLVALVLFAMLLVIAGLVILFGAMQIAISDNRQATASSVWRMLRGILVALAVLIAYTTFAWFALGPHKPF